MKRPSARSLALRRELLVASARLQRAELRDAVQNGPWTPALRLASWLRVAWRAGRALKK